MKQQLRNIAKSFNLLLADRSRIGIELENDLNRITASEPLSIIFDVGANYGQSMNQFTRAYPKAEIYCFEPVSTVCNVLNSTAQQNPRLHIFNLGLGSKPGNFKIGLSENYQGHSIHLADSAKNSENITVSSIDVISRDLGLDHIDLLKIDVEGFELEVLKGAISMLEKKRIRFIYAECVFEPDPSAPHTLFDELRDYLANWGFVFFACYHESFNLSAGSAMANVLFANKSTLPIIASGAIRNIC